MDEEMADRLTKLEMEILVDLLKNGDNTPTNISDNLDRSRSGVQKRLSNYDKKSDDLITYGLVIDKGSGVYALTPQGANTARAIMRAQD